MTKIGGIFYSNSSGLGSIATNFRKHLPLDSQLVIRHHAKGTQYLHEFPSVYTDINAKIKDLHKYLDECKPDIVIIIETPFNWKFFEILHNRGVKVVYIPMVDCISLKEIKPYIQYIDAIITFTKWGYDLYHMAFRDKVHCIPYPIDTDYFHPDKVSDKAYDFIHSQGSGGASYRKSTDQVFAAFQQLVLRNSDITLLVNSQPYEQVHSQICMGIKGATINIEDYPEAINLYRHGQIYVCPSRREGLGLPIYEAMACGLPVITTDAPPMNEPFPKDYPLLVKVSDQQDLPYGDISMYTPNTYDLMLKMEYAYKNLDLMKILGQENRKIIEEKFSWKVLKEKYLKILVTGEVSF